MSAIGERLAKLTLGICIVSLLAIVVVQAWQVVGRYLLNDSPSWTEPMALLLMNTTMACAAALGVRGNAHFRFSLLTERLAPAAQRALDALATAIAVGLGVLLAYGGAVLAWADRDVPMAGTMLPEGVRYLPLVLGGALIAIFALERETRR
jgi:TRAP-type C4-dicarboxylate transport system permease small subunit